MRLLTPEEAAATLAALPAAIRARKRNAESIARIGHYDAVSALNRQTRAYHSTGWHEPISVDIESLPKSAPKSRKMPHKSRTKPLSSAAISYTLRDRSLYWYSRDLHYYIEAYRRGNITRKEIQSIFDWLKMSA